MGTLPLLPPGCRARGRRTRYVDPCEALVALGVEETPETRVAAAVMALEAARYYGLALAMGGGPQARSVSDRLDQVALNLESASAALLELSHVPDMPEEGKRFTALPAVWVAAAAALITSETVRFGRSRTPVPPLSLVLLMPPAACCHSSIG